MARHDQKPRTLQEFARLTGLSVASISRALSGARGVSEKTRAHIQKMATEHGFSPNILARRLASGHSHRLGFIASDLTNPVYINYFHILEKLLRDRDYELLIADSERSSSLEIAHVTRMYASQVEGIFIFPVCEWTGESPAQLVKLLKQYGLKAVGLGSRGLPGHDHVGTDEVHAGGTYGRLLARIGHKKILFINVDDGRNHTSRARLQGFQDSLRDQAEVLVIRSDKDLWIDSVISSIKKGFTACLSAAPTDLFALYRPLGLAGIQVPRDLSLATFGDDYGFAQFLNPIPSILSSDHASIAKRAANFMLERLTEPSLPINELMIRGTLCEGESLKKLA